MHLAETEPSIPEGLPYDPEIVPISDEVKEHLEQAFDAAVAHLSIEPGQEGHQLIDLDSQRAIKVIRAVEQEIYALGYIPSYREQRMVFDDVMNKLRQKQTGQEPQEIPIEDEPISGIGDWRVAAKYGALSAMQNAVGSSKEAH